MADRTPSNRIEAKATEPYAPPSIVVLGTLAELTRGFTNPNVKDNSGLKGSQP